MCKVPLYPACSTPLEAAAPPLLTREQGVGGVPQPQPHPLLVYLQPQHNSLVARCCPASFDPHAQTRDLISGTFSLSLFLPLFLSFFLSFSLSLSLTHTHAHSLSLAHTLTLSCTHNLSPSRTIVRHDLLPPRLLCLFLRFEFSI